MEDEMNRTLQATLITGMSTLALNVFAGDRASSGQAEIAMMDTNQDSRLSAEEHTAGAKAMFSGMDADHDGNVTAAEMDEAHDAMKKSGHDSPNKMSSADKIKVVDTNGDGILSAEEHEAGSRRMFEKMDTDRDGTLTAAEITAGHKTMMKKTN
jgi:Ca2+-binding EF-hand superfamily protein